MLLVSADGPRRWQAALDSGADTLVLDLADRVAITPEDWRLTRSMFDQSRARDPGQRLVVRVSPLSAGFTDADLDLVMPAAPDAILLPLVVGGADIQHLAAKLAVREAECGTADGATRILALGPGPSRRPAKYRCGSGASAFAAPISTSTVANIRFSRTRG